MGGINWLLVGLHSGSAVFKMITYRLAARAVMACTSYLFDDLSTGRDSGGKWHDNS